MEYSVPECPICGEKMNHVGGDSFDCVHWYCEKCDSYNWPVELDMGDKCPYHGNVLLRSKEEVPLSREKETKEGN